MLKRARGRCRCKHVAAAALLLYILYYLGAFTVFVETDFKYFQYPLHLNVLSIVRNVRFSGNPEVRPINIYNYTFVSDCREKCLFNEVSTYRVVFVVKSAVDHFNRRLAIRKSWGFEKRFSDVPMRTVFVLGSVQDSETQRSVDLEQAEHRDIVQASFIDSYYNNTLKTMTALKWSVKHCSNSKFYLFVDDDYYVSTKNLLKFLRNPLEYPQYLESPIVTSRAASGGLKSLSQVMDFELPEDTELYAGYVFPDSRPMRFVLSKWYVNLDDYPYNRYPPYVTAGAIVLSREALMNMYYASFFTKHFIFDDIYVSILARKVLIEPLHSPEFNFYRKKSSSPLDYKHIVASHGFSDPDELVAFWNAQKMAGNA